ncbi:HD domain-containing protein [Bordetella avium]|nr:hydrolase [Bordetella avium]RIQ11697.1 HD domain-containing protein [Bordetella avium]RIQ16117.1 HD domain-containing protein [Bordetella avium]RIQ30272.1 HD domain-containing protein [Bordetella avium]RIQ35687.1 HD domain-containing protein [Bordetella avium]
MVKSRTTAQGWAARARRLADAEMAQDPAHDLNHLDRVWSTARQLLLSHPEADAVVVAIACYLHDLVNLPKNNPRRAQASALSADRARVLLVPAGLDELRIQAVEHAITAHSYSAAVTPRSVEAWIVQDADRLDALGAVGLARMFSIGGALGRALAHPTDPLARARELDDGRYTLDHIELKLAGLPASMGTEAGRRLGAQRLACLREFRAAFAREWLSEEQAGYRAGEGVAQSVGVSAQPHIDSGV